MRPGW
jgi:hypothetical protein